MLRKLASVLFLLTSIVIALGALGHGSQWERHVHAAVAGLPPATVGLLQLIWYWVSGTMLVFGLLLIWTWWRVRRGDRNLFFIPWAVSVFYLVEGAYGAAYLGPFFSLFFVLGLLLALSTGILQRRA